MKCEAVNSAHPGFDFSDTRVQLTVPYMSVEAAQVKPLIPLRATSGHSSSVHKSSPWSVCAHIWKLSDCKLEALRLLVSRYEDANAHPHVISQIQAWTPQSKCNVGSVGKTRCVLVLRYHPNFRKVLFRALALAPVPLELNLEVLVAWRNLLPSVAGGIESHNLFLSGHGRGSTSGASGGNSLCVSDS